MYFIDKVIGKNIGILVKWKKLYKLGLFLFKELFMGGILKFIWYYCMSYSLKMKCICLMVRKK